MKVKEIMSTKVEMIQSNSTIIEAAKKMMSKDIGVLPVQEETRIVGIITDRDIIVRAIAANLDPKTTKVSKIMSRQVSSCSQDEEVEDAAKIMETKQIHRLIVLDSDNKPVGIFSVGDIAMKTSDEHLTWEVMEKISEHTK